MKALSLWQPWASLIMSGAKVHETRSWSAPPLIIGQRIAIHAAMRMVRPFEISPELHRVCMRYLGSTYQHVLPMGSIIGFATLAYSAPVENFKHNLAPDDAVCGNFADGRFGWRMKDIEELAAPIYARGRQKLWNWDETGFDR